MKLFQWTPEKLEWYVRASRKTGFHESIADIIRPLLKKNDAVCDFGCGPGLIDVALADSVREITAVDIDREVIEYLKNETKELGVKNIWPVLGDAEQTVQTLPPYDVALFCYFGGPGAFLKSVLANANRLAVCVMHGIDTTKRPSKIGGHQRRAHAAEMRIFLKNEGIAYRQKNLRLDFSQPLMSIDEARLFFEVYSGNDDSRENIRRRLALVERSSEPAYPWVFPCVKDVSIFVIETQTARK